jgi:hypothetical protein
MVNTSEIKVAYWNGDILSGKSDALSNHGDIKKMCYMENIKCNWRESVYECVYCVFLCKGNHNSDLCVSVTICGENYSEQVRSNLNGVNIVNTSPVTNIICLIYTRLRCKSTERCKRVCFSCTLYPNSPSFFFRTRSFVFLHPTYGVDICYKHLYMYFDRKSFSVVR